MCLNALYSLGLYRTGSRGILATDQAKLAIGARVMTTVVFFLCDKMLATSLTLPLEQLRAAEQMAQARAGSTASSLTIVTASLDGGAVRTQTGLTLTPDCAIDSLQQPDLVYLPALWRNPLPALRQNQTLTPWLIRQHARGTALVGVGTGCCLLAEAGLLNQRPATTHWYYFDAFARRYPQVQLKRQHFITRSDNLFCAASVNSLADLTVFFIQQLFSAPIARSVERHFFHEIRQAYTESLREAGSVQLHPDESIAEAQAWMRDNAHSSLTVGRIAEHCQMSVRTLNRRFKNASGQTPLEYLQGIRMRNARDLLQTTNLSITETAYKTGYQDMAHFNELFKKHFGSTPSQYRTTVRAKLFSAL